jgi:hypothetical protein
MQAGAVGFAGETRGLEEFFGLRGIVVIVACAGSRRRGITEEKTKAKSYAENTESAEFAEKRRRG